MSLANARILVVEDEYLIAIELAAELEAAGAQVIGPVASAAEALRLLEHVEIEAAVLNYTLTDGLSTPVAEKRHDLGKPFVLATSYEPWMLPGTSISVPIISKPIDHKALVRTLLTFVRRQDA